MTLDNEFNSVYRPANRLFFWCIFLSVIAHGASLRWLPGFQHEQIKIAIPKVMDVRLVTPVADVRIQPVHHDARPAVRQPAKQHEPVVEHVKPATADVVPMPALTSPINEKPNQPAEDAAPSSQTATAPVPDLQPVPDTRPDYLNNPRPPYPLAARRLGLEGKVILYVEVLQSGTCGSLEIKQSSGYDMLDQAAMKAVRNWRFTPAKRGGEARTAWVDIPVMFTLNEVDAAR